MERSIILRNWSKKDKCLMNILLVAAEKVITRKWLVGGKLGWMDGKHTFTVYKRQQPPSISSRSHSPLTRQNGFIMLCHLGQISLFTIWFTFKKIKLRISTLVFFGFGCVCLFICFTLFNVIFLDNFTSIWVKEWIEMDWNIWCWNWIKNKL